MSDERCPRCGAARERTQEFCLHCGAALPAARGRDRLHAALLLALVCAAATGASVAVASSRSPSSSTVVATDTRVAVAPGTGAARARGGASGPSVTRPTIATGTLPVAPGAPSSTLATTPPTSPAPPRGHESVRSWPRGKTGYTVVLVSLPETAGRDAAVARAREAARAGVGGVGVLLSSQHSTLRAGYWVVFAGAYPTQAAAQSALAAVRARGYPGAYPARVAP